jgi:heme-degrading monooxygenase HmoA
MFVNIVEFPRIKRGKDAEFRKWFRWSNSVYAKFDGFISRKLLKPIDGNGKYAAIVEHRSKSTFMKMHLSAARQKAWSKVEPLLQGKPTPYFYSVLIDYRARKK